MMRLAVLSPHLDDAILSVGGVLHAASRRGFDTAVITVFAGDPRDRGAAGGWDVRSGFSSREEAVRVRRREDALACAAVGATPIWLPYPDDQYDRDADDESI